VHRWVEAHTAALEGTNMAITLEQKELRRKGIGSSDVPHILGIAPWSNPKRIYESKVGNVDQEVNDAMSEGTILEPAIIQWAQKKIGTQLFSDISFTHKTLPLVANCDAIGGPREPFIVEAKWKPNNRDEDPDMQYGRAGTDQVPLYVLAQVCHQLYVAGPEYRTAYVAVLRGYDGLGFGLYKVKRDDVLCETIVNRCLDWWSRYVVTRTPPESLKAA
jgi:putative phage-type endonuclease